MEKISAIIPTFNEQHNIKQAIESCLFADEIIVVDSFSKDQTVSIVRDYPQVKLLEHEYINSAAQKNWTIPQASHDWIFLLDADERTSENLIKEVKQKVASSPKEVAFWIRNLIISGKEMRLLDFLESQSVATKISMSMLKLKLKAKWEN